MSQSIVSSLRITNPPASLSLRRRLCFGALGFLSHMPSAVACIREGESLSPPMFVVVSGVIVLFVCAVTLSAWGIRRLFFRNLYFFPWLFVAAFVLALMLGFLGSFAVPAFESVYAPFGPDISPQTKAVFGAKQLLWLPFPLLLGLWRLTRNRPSKSRYFAWALFAEVNLLLLVLAALYSGIFVLGSVC